MPKKKMNLATVNLNTGDVKNEVFIYCLKKRHSSFSEEQACSTAGVCLTTQTCLNVN